MISINLDGFGLNKTLIVKLTFWRSLLGDVDVSSMNYEKKTKIIRRIPTKTVQSQDVRKTRRTRTHRPAYYVKETTEIEGASSSNSGWANPTERRKRGFKTQKRATNCWT